MKLLNGEIFNAREPLQKLLSKEFPVKVSYGLAKLASKLNEEFQTIEKVRQGLVQRYGKADKETPTQTMVDPLSDKYPKFIEELTELMNQEVEVVVEKVTLPSEVDGKSIQIEPNVLMALEKFVEV